jgi:hypothetical protein
MELLLFLAFHNRKTFGSNGSISGTIKSGWCLATILSNASPSSMLLLQIMGDLHGGAFS